MAFCIRFLKDVVIVQRGWERFCVVRGNFSETGR